MAFDIPDEYYDCVKAGDEEIPDRLYHVAPKDKQKTILDEGLLVDESRTHNTGGSYGDDPDDDWLYEDYGEGPIKSEWRPHGVYVWPTIEQALSYQNPETDDIYEIDTESVSCDIIRDPSVAPNWDYEDRNKAYVLEYVAARDFEIMDSSMVEKAKDLENTRPNLGDIDELERASPDHEVSKDQLSFDLS